MTDPAASSVIALCGLGNMGAAIASRLATRFRPLLFDLDVERANAVASSLNLMACASVGELSAADVVVLCLPSPRASLRVVETLAPSMRAGAVIVETSTVGSDHVAHMARSASVHGVGVVDAAIAAGVAQMSSGVAALLVGGQLEHVEIARPVLEAIASSVYIIGPSGSGAALKVINNAVAHAVMVVLIEAAALAESFGIDRSALIRLMSGSDAGLTRPLEHRLMERIANGDYDGGMPTEAALKDSVLALEFAHRQGVPLFAISGSHAVYEMATAEGFARDDYAGIARLWERWLGKTLRVTTEKR